MISATSTHLRQQQVDRERFDTSPRGRLQLKEETAHHSNRNPPHTYEPEGSIAHPEDQPLGVESAVGGCIAMLQDNLKNTESSLSVDDE